jgi:uncharacterized protein
VPSSMELLYDGPAEAAWTIALAHGAGAGMNSAFLNAFAAGLGEQGFRVVRFEFPYMASFTQTGKKRPPDREPVLRAAWLQVIDKLGRERLVIGGKSMGGRIASLIADEAGVAGLVCLGYPFHPVGKSDKLRVAHLQTIQTPTLILQGTRDTFGNREEVGGYELAAAVTIHWLKDGNHDFTPRRSAGVSEEQNWQEALTVLGAFVNNLGANRKK